MEQQIGLGDRRVALHIDGPRAERVARFVCGAAFRDGGTAVDRIAILQHEHHLQLINHLGETRTTDSEVNAADILSASMVESLVRDVTAGPTFHAAATLYQDQAIVMPGICGAGKSTLTAWLCHVRSHKYLSDEAVLVRSDNLQLEYVQRPVHLKQGSHRFAEQHGLLGLPDRDAWYLDEHAWIAPGLFNGRQITPKSVPIGALVLPAYDASVSLSLEPIASARAAAQLLQVFLNAPLVRDQGFQTVAAAFADIPAYRLTYSDTERLPEAWDQIESDIEAHI